MEVNFIKLSDTILSVSCLLSNRFFYFCKYIYIFLKKVIFFEKKSKKNTRVTHVKSSLFRNPLGFFSGYYINFYSISSWRGLGRLSLLSLFLCRFLRILWHYLNFCFISSFCRSFDNGCVLLGQSCRCIGMPLHFCFGS